MSSLYPALDDVDDVQTEMKSISVSNQNNHHQAAQDGQGLVEYKNAFKPTSSSSSIFGSEMIIKKDLSYMARHTFKHKVMSRQLFCVVCAETIIPLAQKLHKCGVCKKVAHEKCVAEAGPCYGPDGVRPLTGHFHAFVGANYRQPTVCQHCNSLLLKLTQQGDKCIECGFNVHRDCRPNLPPHCYGTPTSNELAISLPCPGLTKREDGYRARFPIVLVPGLCSSGLVIMKSDSHPSWVGTRAWFSLNKLSTNMFKNVRTVTESVRTVTENVRTVTERLQGEYPSNANTLSEALGNQSNFWLQHMGLPGDQDPEGIMVRPMQGIDAVDFLEPGAMTSGASWVFGPLIQSLRYVGYTDCNLVAAPYDWRMSMGNLEKRDGYFSNLLQLVEDTSKRNNMPVVLLAHSMGNVITKYFLHFAERVKGRDWIDRHIYSFLAAGAPFLGATKAARSTADGDNMGLTGFLNADEARLLCRSMGSAVNLWPIGPLNNPFNYVKREGMVTIQVVRATISPAALPKAEYFITITKEGGQSISTQPVEANQNALPFSETFQFSSRETDRVSPEDKYTVCIFYKHSMHSHLFGEVTLSLDDIIKSGSNEGAKRILFENEDKGVKSSIDTDFIFNFDPALSNLPILKINAKQDYNVVPLGQFFCKCGAAKNWEDGQQAINSDPFSVPYHIPPPVSNLKVIYGVNVKTEVAYGWRVRTQCSNNQVYMRYKLDKKITLADYSSSEGIIYETEKTPQKRLDTGEQVTSSGDGTVPYQSLRFPGTWKGIPGLCVDITEHAGMKHREMLDDPVFHDDVINYCCAR
eukprot:Ihof_evm2s462 gene=Ihof_evmTU2s462